jgi:hypothetical protein
MKEFGHGHRRPNNYKELFNHRHVVLRNHIQRAIGVLKKHFPIEKVRTHHPMKNQVKIPATTAIFHNIICMHHGDEAWLDNQLDNIPPTSFVDLPDGDNNYNNDVVSLSSQIENGNVVRDAIAL